MQVSIRKVENGYTLKAKGIDGIWVCKNDYELDSTVKMVFNYGEYIKVQEEKETKETAEAISEIVERLAKSFDEQVLSYKSKGGCKCEGQ
jgi:uncharacterized lipoprotein YmbA